MKPTSVVLFFLLASCGAEPLNPCAQVCELEQVVSESCGAGPVDCRSMWPECAGPDLEAALVCLGDESSCAAASNAQAAICREHDLTCALDCIMDCDAACGPWCQDDPACVLECVYLGDSATCAGRCVADRCPA